jgi:O-antigen/teichoic acid export membrane protein
MAGITITSIILTQTDKVILSKALSLTDFGIYVVASTLATGLYMLISPMFSVMYPRFASLIHSGEVNNLADLYHTSSQAMAALIIPIAFVVAVFAKEILYVWTGDIGLSQQGAWILTFLITGNACNGIMNMPYALQLASGWTKLAFWMNVGAIIFLAPLVWWVAVKVGSVGGAAVWALLIVGYVMLTPHIMHIRIMQSEKLIWYWSAVALPVSVCSVLLFALRLIPLDEMSRHSMGFVLMIYWLLASIVTTLFLPRIRTKIAQIKNI